MQLCSSNTTWASHRRWAYRFLHFRPGYPGAEGSTAPSPRVQHAVCQEQDAAHAHAFQLRGHAMFQNHQCRRYSKRLRIEFLIKPQWPLFQQSHNLTIPRSVKRIPVFLNRNPLVQPRPQPFRTFQDPAVFRCSSGVFLATHVIFTPPSPQSTVHSPQSQSEQTKPKSTKSAKVAENQRRPFNLDDTRATVSRALARSLRY